MAKFNEHQPTKATRDTVSLHSLVGTPQEVIAGVLGIDAKTLRKYYRDELDYSLAKANATLGGTLYNKAKDGDTTALIFWLKTRAGFREQKEDDAPKQDQTITINLVDAKRENAS